MPPVEPQPPRVGARFRGIQRNTTDGGSGVGRGSESSVRRAGGGGGEGTEGSQQSRVTSGDGKGWRQVRGWQHRLQRGTPPGPGWAARGAGRARGCPHVSACAPQPALAAPPNADYKSQQASRRREPGQGHPARGHGQVPAGPPLPGAGGRRWGRAGERTLTETLFSHPKNSSWPFPQLPASPTLFHQMKKPRKPGTFRQRERLRAGEAQAPQIESGDSGEQSQRKRERGARPQLFPRRFN